MQTTPKHKGVCFIGPGLPFHVEFGLLMAVGAPKAVPVGQLLFVMT